MYLVSSGLDERGLQSGSHLWIQAFLVETFWWFSLSYWKTQFAASFQKLLNGHIRFSLWQNIALEPSSENPLNILNYESESFIDLFVEYHRFTVCLPWITKEDHCQMLLIANGYAPLRKVCSFTLMFPITPPTFYAIRPQ